jgi:hypothetical protein
VGQFENIASVRNLIYNKKLTTLDADPQRVSYPSNPSSTPTLTLPKLSKCGVGVLEG